MSNWKDRIIQNDNTNHPVASLPPDFLSEIMGCQIDANKGWAPDADDLIDQRVVNCPTCNAPGMNTCFGYWAFTCGAEILSDGEVDVPCGAQGEPK